MHFLDAIDDDSTCFFKALDTKWTSAAALKCIVAVNDLRKLLIFWLQNNGRAHYMQNSVCVVPCWQVAGSQLCGLLQHLQARSSECRHVCRPHEPPVAQSSTLAAAGSGHVGSMSQMAG